MDAKFGSVVKFYLYTGPTLVCSKIGSIGGVNDHFSDFDPNRESSFSSLRESKETLLGIPERSFYEVLRFCKKKLFFDVKIFSG